MNEKIVLTPSNLVTYGQRWRKETREDLLIINPRFFEAGYNVIPVANAIDGVVPGPNGLLPMLVRPIWGAAPINAQQERDYNFEVKEYQASYTMRSDENKITMTYRTRWTETTKLGLELVKSRVSVDIWKRLTEAQKASVAAIWTPIEEMITGGTRNSGVIRALHESQRYYYKLGGLREFYNN
jgi:hypothetical protein